MVGGPYLKWLSIALTSTFGLALSEAHWQRHIVWWNSGLVFPFSWEENIMVASFFEDLACALCSLRQLPLRGVFCHLNRFCGVYSCVTLHPLFTWLLFLWRVPMYELLFLERLKFLKSMEYDGLMETRSL